MENISFIFSDFVVQGVGKFEFKLWIREAFNNKKTGNSLFFYQRGGSQKKKSLVQFPVFSSEKTGNPLEVWFSTEGG